RVLCRSRAGRAGVTATSSRAAITPGSSGRGSGHWRRAATATSPATPSSAPASRRAPADKRCRSPQPDLIDQHPELGMVLVVLQPLRHEVDRLRVKEEDEKGAVGDRPVRGSPAIEDEGDRTAAKLGHSLVSAPAGGEGKPRSR